MSVVEVKPLSKADREAKARARAEVKAAILKKRKRCVRSEKVYDEETGELIEDDDDLEDDEDMGLGGLLDDPDALVDRSMPS